ncbi:Cof-type HAD-IIB family hydrolase [Lacticaseibacillus absianus]|uniref:Cof-type HAD-IIB family hydrolase n=1 Tax=Lacticaseibacillus absianus TaxID=2729623 RepID=UPI0015CA0F28|nr:Cof-type HAD-IIB family hydrolase [Lacticaseibacillus absianus]
MTQLFATDMDGTFLRADMTYDRERFSRLYAKMQAQGIRWVVASGNQVYQLRSFFTDYPETLFVAENGAYLGTTTEELAVHHFSDEAVAAILPIVSALPDVNFLVCGAESAYTLATTPADYVTFARQYYHRLLVVDRYEDVHDRILKFALTCPPAQTDALVAELKTALGAWAEPTSSGHGDIDLIQPGLHKAAGLAELGGMLDIPLSAMCAFGDGGNDLEMLREVGTGVAMANATPAVKAVADVITGTNADAGVLQYMEHVL